MKTKEIRSPESLNSQMIAPCGMNCGLCIGYLRERKPCAGCNGDDDYKPKHCVICRIKTCPEMDNSEQKYCFVCARFPCSRLRQLDNRYRTRYGMSMIENLEGIQNLGLEEFVAREKKRWKCPECGGLICVHRESCIYCNRTRD